MGLFGTYLYDGDSWTAHDADIRPESTGPWLMVDVHDSDIAIISYHPPGPGTGVAYIGVTPRVYFDDENASDPTDVAREAEGLAAWREELGVSPVTSDDLVDFLAEDDPEKWGDDEDEDEVESFVEAKTAEFLTALNVPVPDDLRLPT
ncbi:hypothetical protein [Kibdelosporangium phytohabitans]|uniref:Uncharacterized protein n=1 Tax=Kibdelosporangium phytohabitans TaxID=860235 RepID=A0A0N9HNW4_9PSEU|nr:hypothetical protein [Kibdelosporangium phytohabitans]ALG06158.1 hypothetical protein AOZ06_03780 [Kibdelosporangium phytohabitans]MBE1465748.1 hypothetical protein [Kibdelosporangium phytohabitans]